MKIGILGGGQLARMMILRGFDMGFEMHVLSQHASDPAAQVTSFWHQGDTSDLKTLEKFMKAVDLVTFESEFMDAEVLKSFMKLTPIWPSPDSMGILQDRLSQKSTLVNAKVPTADFIEVNSLHEISHFLKKHKAGVVLKKRRGGYDGYGTFHIKNEKDLESFEPVFAKEETGFIAEERLAFKRELAISLARNEDGEIVHLPLVETHQQNSRCLWVKGPTKNSKITPLLKHLKKFVKDLNYVGVIAFELFEMKNGALLVNEVAPRVHNSAHYSLDALNVDQFSLHLQAILNHHLATPQILKPFAMLNLLGESDRTPKAVFDPEVYLHWYGKADNRPGRKMGHLNTLAKTPEEGLKRLLKHRKKWEL